MKKTIIASESDYSEEEKREIIENYLEGYNERLKKKPDYGKDIGKRIETALKRFNEKTGLGIDKTRLAKLLSLSQSKITSMINGNRPPKIDQLIDLAKLLHVSTDYLLGIEDYTSDLDNNKEETRITGLSQLSISNLIKYNNSKDDSFEMDSLFRNYNINFTIIIRNEPRNKAQKRLPNRIPNLIFNSDFSKYIPDMSIDVLNLSRVLNIKLKENNITTIALLIMFREDYLKKYAQLNDNEINTVKESARQFFDNVFDEKTYSLETGRAFKGLFMNEYSDDLFFLNSIIEDGTTFLSIEECVYTLYNLEVQMEINTRIINSTEEMIENIKEKNSGSFENYSESDQNDYLVFTESKNEFLKIRSLYTSRIEQTKMNLYSSISRAVDKYIKERIQKVKDNSGMRA